MRNAKAVTAPEDSAIASGLQRLSPKLSDDRDKAGLELGGQIEHVEEGLARRGAGIDRPLVCLRRNPRSRSRECCAPSDRPGLRQRASPAGKVEHHLEFDPAFASRSVRLFGGNYIAAGNLQLPADVMVDRQDATIAIHTARSAPSVFEDSGPSSGIVPECRPCRS